MSNYIVGMINGQLSVRPSKIVAGHEPEKTNEFLQAMGTAILSKVSLLTMSISDWHHMKLNTSCENSLIIISSQKRKLNLFKMSLPL